MSFDPGLQNANVPSTRQPYPEGAAAIRMSLETMAQKIREGRLDPAVIGWARGMLKDAGIDGRGNGPVIRQQAAALLDALRAQTVYAPDAAAAEVISSAGATLCLRPNLCLHGGDCFPTGTLLLRNDYEFVPIEKIRVGDKIWGLDKWTEIKAVTFKGVLRVDAVEMNNGSTMHLTGDHKVYAGRCKHDRGVCPTCYPALRQVRFERVAVSDLQEDEVLLQPERIAFGEGTPDPDRMYVEGLALADGWVCKESCFHIAGRDGMRKEVQKHEVKAICDRLGISTHWHKRYITIKDPAWAQRIAGLGERARFKHLETLNLAEAPAREALRGLMADSTRHSQRAYKSRTYSTTSHMLMLQVRVLQRMFGVSMGLKFMTPEQHGAGRHPMWRLGERAPSPDRNEKTLMVKSIERAIRKVACWDIQTEDHYVYLPEHDVTVSNCDDLSVALGSATLSLGIPTAIVKQTFSAQNQEHVLIAVQDESGTWLYADPSTRMPLGSASRASEEVWVDPLGPIGPLPEVHAELVTLGAVPRGVMRFEGGCWWHQGFGDSRGALVHHGGEWRSSGLGSIPSRVGLGTLFGHPTVTELIEFSGAVGYAVTQLNTAEALCTAGWPQNPVGWSAWQMDMQGVTSAYQTALNAVSAKANDTAEWLQAFTTADYEWSLLVDIMGRVTDLDRRLRQDNECAAPGYEDMPQPVATDWDLQAYKDADVVARAADKAVAVAKAAVAPGAMALGGVVVGVVVAVAGILVLDRLVPAR